MNIGARVKMILAAAGLLTLMVLPLVGFRSVSLKTGWEVFEDVQEFADRTSAALYYTMVAIDGKGEVQSGKAFMFFDMVPEDSRMILHITEPEEWVGISMLVIQREDRTDSVYLQRPGMVKAEEIKGRLLQNYLLFMSWSYMDFLFEKKDAENYERQGDYDLDGVDCYQVVARPITPERQQMSGYSERRFWVSKEEMWSSRSIS